MYEKFNIIIFILLFIFSGNGYTQELTESEIIVDNRLDVLAGENKDQGRIRIGFVVDLHGAVEIVGIISTGDAYRNEWFSITPPNGDSSNQPFLAFRNIYLRKVFGKNKQFEVDLGALNGETVVGAAGIPPAGWVDGLRVKASTSLGDIRVVAGSLGDYKNPNAFTRDFDANFIEVELSRKIFNELVVSSSYRHLEDEDGVSLGAKYNLKIFGDKVIKLFGKALYSFPDDSFNYDVGLEIDVLKTIFDKFEKRLELKVYFSSIDERSSDAQRIPLFFTYGPRATFQLSGDIVPGKINWMARSSFGENNTSRYDVGVQMKFGYKKKQ